MAISFVRGGFPRAASRPRNDECFLLNALECRHLGILSLQLFDALEGDLLALTTAATGANITDDTHITADGVTVNGVVDGAVADAEVVHAADDGLEGFHILCGVAVQLHIADVTCVTQSVVGSFQTDLVVSGDGIPYGDMERVGVVLTVGDAGELAEEELTVAQITNALLPNSDLS